jgi:hypothetical protein
MHEYKFETTQDSIHDFRKVSIQQPIDSSNEIVIGGATSPKAEQRKLLVSRAYFSSN